ncbi:MAG: ribonuclease Z [Syntrophus sp. PtaU1.Bin208]|nr:MAG: ribonuclease Z [Syntrophus sp. PtaU1.Bin208]
MYSASLVNDPFGDPAVLIKCKYRHESVLFDLGDLHTLAPREMLKIGHIFVSHTHVDHFIGFDTILRVCLGRNQRIRLFGPPGFLSRVESKLQGYTWNLVENYSNDFELLVTELSPFRRISRLYRCRAAFRPEPVAEEEIPETAPLVEETFFSIRGAFLNHLIPCLAFRFEEKSRLNILKNGLEDLGLPTGPWLMDLKEAILQGRPDNYPIRIWEKSGGRPVEKKPLPLGFLKEKAVKITRGQRICYVTDAVFTHENVQRILDLVDSADHLFIEATFLQKDLEKATLKHHLTARQAGFLARQAAVKRFSLFHFSPKYKEMGDALQVEAREAFNGKTPVPCPPVSPSPSQGADL